MKNKRKHKKILSILLSAAMLFSAVPIYALAAGGQDACGLCEHHQEHTAECGYIEGAPCTHEHNEECYSPVTNCVHEHTEDCYPTESVSDTTATPADEDGQEPTECAHECSEENSCITKVLDCKHQHDESCGYSSVTSGTPCTYVCEICNPQNSGAPTEPECICETFCKNDAVNVDCPVCGADGTDLTLCIGKVKEIQALIDALPTEEELEAMDETARAEVLAQIEAICAAIEAMDGADAAQFDRSRLDALVAASRSTLAVNGAVTNFEELVSAVSAAPEDGTETVIVLGSDIEFTDTVTIKSEQNIVIVDDGTARTISAVSELSGNRVYAAFSVEEGGVLTIKTSVPGSNHLFTINGENFHSHYNGASIVLVKGTFTLEGGTISGSYDTASTCSGAITVSGQRARFRMDGGVITGHTFTGQYGGTIYVTAGAAFEMYGGVISDNTGTDPLNNATVYIEADDGDSAFYMYGGTIKENTVAYGGVFIGKPAYPDYVSCAEMTMYDGATISDNTSIGQGGGGVMVCGQAKFTMEGGTIQNNTAYMGGGVCVYDMYHSMGGAGNYDIETWSEFFPAAFTMKGGTIQGNQAVGGNNDRDTGCGGGIYVGSNNVTLRGGTIKGNTANRQGGGVYVGSVPYVMTIHNALVTNNTATVLGGGVWACPTGDTEVFVTNGAGIYDNTSSGAGNDVVSVKTDGQNYVLTLANRILGGGQVLWYKDGGIAQDSSVLGNPDNSPRYQSGDTPISEIENSTEPYALKAAVSDHAKELAQKTAALLITGNKSERGGGIGTNGGVIMGEKDREYTLKVKKEWKDTDENLKQSVTVYLKVGDTVLDPVTLSKDNNWEAEFKDLPDPDTLHGVSYAVVENPVPDQFIAAYQPAAIDKDNRIITIDISNTYQPSKTGSLTISKTVTGSAGNTTKAFSFKITLANEEGEPVTGTFPYTGKSNVPGAAAPTDGYLKLDANVEASITLSHGQSITISGLPLNITYEVVEQEANQDGYTTTSTGQSGTITEAGASASFVNTKNDSTPDPETGNLTVSKTVSGNAGGQTKPFNFTVTLSDTSINGKYGDMTFKDGKAAFTLKHGESKTAAGLPAGTTYIVVEAEANQNGYVTSPTGESGTIPENGTASAVFVNTKNRTGSAPDPKTGDETNLALWIALASLSGFAMISIPVLSRRRYKGKHRHTF